MKSIDFLGWFFDLAFLVLIIFMFLKSDIVVAVFSALLLAKFYASNCSANATKKQLEEYRYLTDILINRFNANCEELKKRRGK